MSEQGLVLDVRLYVFRGFNIRLPINTPRFSGRIILFSLRSRLEIDRGIQLSFAELLLSLLFRF